VEYTQRWKGLNEFNIDIIQYILINSQKKFINLTLIIQDMNESDRTIEFFDVKPSELYESIDKKLRGAGGKDAFKMQSRGTKVYAYDFPNINSSTQNCSTAMVFIRPESDMMHGNNANYMNTKKSACTVLLLGFEQNEIYDGLCNALIKLKTSYKSV